MHVVIASMLYVSTARARFIAKLLSATLTLVVHLRSIVRHAPTRPALRIGEALFQPECESLDDYKPSGVDNRCTMNACRLKIPITDRK
jgi:hypothetical protein